ncbi:MAG: hypothetical protein DA328_01465 [Nitrososphaeraceae archaeon]|nr:hypothetical protein [Nitrososphaeraceae archaeon]
MKVIDTIKAYIQSNIRFPHPALLAIGVSAAITAITIGIFYMTDAGLFGQEAVEAPKKITIRGEREE